MKKPQLILQPSIKGRSGGGRQCAAEGAACRAMEAVDRKRTCPMLVRMYCRINGHHHVGEFERGVGALIGDEVDLYTWRDATLRELAGLIQQVNDQSCGRHVVFSFALVCQSSRDGAFYTHTLGRVANDRKGPDDGLTLWHARFIQGDYIDVAIYTDASLVPSSRHASSQARRAGPSSSHGRQASRDHGRPRSRH